MDMLVPPRGFYQCVLLALLCFGGIFYLAVAPAESDPAGASFASPWTEQAAGMARMRLISVAMSHGVYDAAAEIQLKPTAHTYWRQPGEAGVPPVFSFSGSENLARAEVLYPAPQRLEEAGLSTFGYRGGVTFPIRVTPRDPAKPVRLDLGLSYAVCDQICIPAKAHVELALPQSGASPAASAIAAALAQVPVAVPAAELADKVAISLVPSGKAKSAWSLHWKGAMPASDLFAEGPDGWAFETHATGKNVFLLSLLEKPDTFAGTRVAVRFTVTGPGKAYEFAIPLSLANIGR